MSEKQLFIYRGETFVGTLFANQINGKETYSFEFDKEYLKSDSALMYLDSNLSAFPGRQYLSYDRKIFGFIEDCLPDRFGRNLIKREEMTLAKKENRKAKSLTEYDYLIRLDDESRMGDIRLKLDKNGPFISQTTNPIPNIIYINQLEQSSRELEDDKNIEENLKILLSPGSSLGGARPKANVYDNNGDLWLCKFPSKNDDYDVELFEKVCLDLQEMCEIRVPESKLLKVSKYGSTLLVKRFDRNKDERIHYLSAMTALDAIDGDNSLYSYLDIVAFVKSNFKNPKNELKELFKRTVFSIFVSNTDNHLRNHGFLFIDGMWQLSPVFDVNPNPYKGFLSLGLDDKNSSLDADYLKSISAYFGLTEDASILLIENIRKVIKDNWISISKKYGASQKDIDFLSSCFTD